MSARRYVLHAPASERGEGSPLAILRRCGCEPVPAGPGELRDRARELWGRAETLVFLFSLPVTVRIAGPLLSDKGTDPAALYAAMLTAHFPGGLKAPFNEPARDQAGFPATWYTPLVKTAQESA